MRSITALSFGVLAFAGTCAILVTGPSARGDGECLPSAVRPAPAPAPSPNPPAVPASVDAPPTAAAPTTSPDAPKPAKEAAIKNPLFLALVGDWGCDCAYPTGGHAAGGASAKLILDGTAVMTESSLDWTVRDGKDKETIQSLGIWKVAADGKSVSYWGFSSHDSAVDLLTGEATDTSVTVSGTTRFGPMRLTLSLKDGVFSQQLWIDKTDMGVIAYKKREAAK